MRSFFSVKLQVIVIVFTSLQYHGPSGLHTVHKVQNMVCCHDLLNPVSCIGLNCSIFETNFMLSLHHCSWNYFHDQSEFWRYNRHVVWNPNYGISPEPQHNTCQQSWTKILLYDKVLLAALRCLLKISIWFVVDCSEECRADIGHSQTVPVKTRLFRQMSEYETRDGSQGKPKLGLNNNNGPNQAIVRVPKRPCRKRYRCRYYDRAYHPNVTSLTYLNKECFCCRQFRIRWVGVIILTSFESWFLPFATHLCTCLLRKAACILCWSLLYRERYIPHPTYPTFEPIREPERHPVFGSAQFIPKRYIPWQLLQYHSSYLF